MLELSKITVKKTTSSIQINVEIPIIFRKNYSLFEIIPIPTSHKKITSILNLNSFLYFADNENLKILSFNAFENCLKLENLTLCNSIIINSLEQPDVCKFSLIFNDTQNNCETKEITHRNYIMETSAHSVFCHIVHPITLKISCIEKYFVYELNVSKELMYDAECDIYEVVNAIMGNNTDLKTIEINFAYFKPNFSYYDNVLQNWTYNITSINRRNIDLLERITDTENLILKIQNAKHINSTSIFTGIVNLVKQISFSKWILKIVLTYIVLPLILYQLIICCLKMMRRK